MAHPSQFVVIIGLVKTTNEQTDQSSKKSAPFSTQPLCVEVARVQLCVDFVDRENSDPQQVLQEELFDLDMLQPSGSNSLDECHC